MTDWIAGALGGLLIGGAAALYLLGNGRIMGASGILGGLVDGSGRQDPLERLAFVAALIAAPALLRLADSTPAETGLTGNVFLIIAAGLLVGLGTRLGNGCTSGHGVCGISRLSLRGILATVTFIAAGMVTVATPRILGGL